MKTRIYKLGDIESATELDRCIYFTRLGVRPGDVIEEYQRCGDKLFGESDKWARHISVRGFRIAFFEQDGRTMATLKGMYRERVKAGVKVGGLWYPGEEITEKFGYTRELLQPKVLSKSRIGEETVVFKERPLEDIARFEDTVQRELGNVGLLKGVYYWLERMWI